jgi:hypothetical protein
LLSIKRKWGLTIDCPVPNPVSTRTISGGETVWLQSGEILAELKPRMVFGYCSLKINEFQRANITGEDDNADARGYTHRAEGRNGGRGSKRRWMKVQWQVTN